MFGAPWTEQLCRVEQSAAVCKSVLEEESDAEVTSDALSPSP